MSYEIGHQISFSKSPPYIRVSRLYKPGTRISFVKQIDSEPVMLSLRLA